MDNQRGILFEHWARVRNFYKYQPLDHIKDYFGVKIGLYFAWLGFYTYMLIPASMLGIICFLYGVFTLSYHQTRLLSLGFKMNRFFKLFFHFSIDICNEALNISMCPSCDTFCDFTKLHETCFYSQLTYLVDNPATVAFAVIMSFWGK